MTRLEVWGDPISHSRSPGLHVAAYRTLGLDWRYSRRRVSTATFEREFLSLDATIRGLSLTMPLKERAFDIAISHDERAQRTGSVNTLVLTAEGPRGYNTDVGGFIGALRENGVATVGRARIVGAGATAASAMVALAEMGAETIDVVARSPQKATHLKERASALGVAVRTMRFDQVVRGGESVDVTIATLPGSTIIDDLVADKLAETGGVLIDAVYAPWPTQLGTAFSVRGSAVASGELMLLHQAVLQVRLFVAGDSGVALQNEATVVAMMRRALMGD